MLTRALTVVGAAASAALLHSSLETLITDAIVGVTIAIALFVLYYALVLRGAGNGRRRRGNP